MTSSRHAQYRERQSERRTSIVNTSGKRANRIFLTFSHSRHRTTDVPLIEAEYQGVKADISPISAHVVGLYWKGKEIPPNESVRVSLQPEAWYTRANFLFSAPTDLATIPEEILRITRSHDDLAANTYRFRRAILRHAFPEHEKSAERTAAEFFTWLDQQTSLDPLDTQNWCRRRLVDGRLSVSLEFKVSADEVKFRRRAVGSLNRRLMENLKFRAERYPRDCGTIPLDDRETRERIECIAEVFFDAFYKHYPDQRMSIEHRPLAGFDWVTQLDDERGSERSRLLPGAVSSIDLWPVDRAFELFANGELRPSADAIREALESEGARPELIELGFPIAHFQPDGANYFLFAEFAITCARMGYLRPLMKRFAQTAVRTAWIVASRYQTQEPSAARRVRDFDFRLPTSPDDEGRAPQAPPGLSSEVLWRLRRRFRRMTSLDDLEHELGFLAMKAFPRTRWILRKNRADAEGRGVERAAIYEGAEESVESDASIPSSPSSTDSSPSEEPPAAVESSETG